MKTRSFLIGFILLSSVLAMAGPAVPPQPSDWVDRMLSARGFAPALTVAEPVDRTDWVDRMIAGRSPVQDLANANPTDQTDWVDRMIAARSSEPASAVSLWQITRVEAAFSEACTTKDLAMVLSLFARDATLTSGGKTYIGVDQIRNYWAQSGPFQPQNHWAVFTPVHRSTIGVDENRATLRFECLWVDSVTGHVQAHSYSNDLLVRDGNRWVIEDMKAGVVAGI